MSRDIDPSSTEAFLTESLKVGGVLATSSALGHVAGATAAAGALGLGGAVVGTAVAVIAGREYLRLRAEREQADEQDDE